MRRHLLTLIAAPALLLGACSGEEAKVTEASTPVTTPGALRPTDDATVTTQGDDAPSSAPAPATSAPATSTPTTDDDQASASAHPDVEGGAEGQAAADRAKAFLLSLVKADPAACDLLLSFTDPEQPMTAVESDLELCRTQLPETMRSTVEAQGLGEEGVAILEAMQITGAQVDGDVAVIDQDNYSELFAEAMGDSTITLRRLGGEWYVDIDAYLETP